MLFLVSPWDYRGGFRFSFPSKPSSFAPRNSFRRAAGGSLRSVPRADLIKGSDHEGAKVRDGRAGRGREGRGTRRFERTSSLCRSFIIGGLLRCAANRA